MRCGSVKKRSSSVPLFKTLREFYYEYELPLAHAFYNIEQRGLLVDQTKLSVFRKYLEDEIKKSAELCYTLCGEQFNLGSPAQVIKILKKRGLKVPNDRKTGRPTSNEKGLFRLLSQTGDQTLQHILRSRELIKVKGTYVDTALLDNVLLCSYVVAGTKTGRRSSRKNFLGLGTNHQNLPKHSNLGMRFRECVIARPGKIFLACDQKSAEDWGVHGLIADWSHGGCLTGINELLSGINRHRKLAGFIFGKPESDCGKDTALYYLGKKTRHAGNYGMRGRTMSEALAGENIHIGADQCDVLLTRFHSLEPQIRQVFQAGVEEHLFRDHTLTTPVGRSRVFFDLRSGSDNAEVLRDAFSYIPQSLIGDNNGLAILDVERHEPGLVVSDGHDSTTLEVDDNVQSILLGVRALERAYNRTHTFENGFQMKIPIEFELGYSLGEMKTCDDVSEVGLRNIYDGLHQSVRPQSVIIVGQDS
jgi:hypothetical protein